MRPKDKDGLAVIAALREAEDAIGAAMQCAARTMDTIDTLRVRVAELEREAAPEGCRSLPAAEQAVVPLLDDWLLFSDDIQPACAAGHDWLDSLRSRTQIAIAKLRQGEKPACLPEPPEGE